MAQTRIWCLASAIASILAMGLAMSCTHPSGTIKPSEKPLASPTPSPIQEPTPQGPPINASPGDIWIRPVDDMPMVYIPAGEFPYGPGSTTDIPAQSTYLDAFWIDQTEVTNAQYARCVAEGGCSEPLYTNFYDDPAYADHPIIWISRTEAEAYCAWAGARLPSEIEWEKAARGTDGRVFPWGDKFDVARVNCYESGIRGTQPVGSYPGGASPYGVLDMSGNVCEWTRDLWRTTEDYLKKPVLPPGTRPKGRHPIGHHYTLRGGSWASLESSLTTYARANEEPGWRTKDIGFRCVKCASRSP